MPEFQENRHPVPVAVRDLEWVVSSPLLLTKAPYPDLFNTAKTRHFLYETRANPEPLIDYLSKNAVHALGPYFEKLVLYWLSNLPSTRLIASNIQIYREKQTIGELDVLFEHNNQTYHWELAVKFYLNIGSGKKESDFVGPRLKDRLDIKLARLFDHQIPRIKTPEAQRILSDFDVTSVTSSAIVKGVLFQPHFDHFTKNTPLPQRISEDCLTGTWITISNLENSNLPSFDRFLLLKKAQWFTGCYYPQEVMTGNIATLINLATNQIDTHQTPIMACLFKSAETDNLMANDRIFIVPDNWPDLARKAHYS